MADQDVSGENVAQAAQNGSSSESSDVSIEKLNPEESEATEKKPTEDENKVLSYYLNEILNCPILTLNNRTTIQINISLFTLGKRRC